MTGRYRKGVLATGALALALYLPGFWWGAPHATSALATNSWGTDDESPLGPLAEIHNILDPKPDRALGYPLLFSFVLAACFAPYLAALWLTGGLGTASATYPYGLADPVTTLEMLTYIAHFVTVLLGAGVVVLAYLTARTFWSRTVAWVAAALVASSYPMFYYARNANVDVPMLFFVAGATFLFARCLESGWSTRRAAVLGVWIGAALATKEAAFGSFLVLPLAFVFSPRGSSRSSTVAARRWRPVAALTVGLVVALGLGSGLFVEPSRYFAHLEFLTGRLRGLSAETVALSQTYPFSLEGHGRYLARLGRLMVDLLTVPGLAWAGLGLAVLGLRQPRRALVPLMGVTSLLSLFLVLRVLQVRYLLPASFAFCLAVAGAHAYLLEGRSKLLRSASWLVVAFVVTIGLLRGARMTQEMLFDSRYAAGRWLAERTQPADRIDYFGPESKLPPLREGLVVERPVPYHGFDAPLEEESVRMEQILARWRSRPPKYILLIPDLTSRGGKPYSASCPEPVCESLLRGDSEYELAARFHTQPILDRLPRPTLDYPTVNPPIHVFARRSEDPANRRP